MRLEEVRARCPELRFGQMIAAIGLLAEDDTGFSLWEVEDADFGAALARFAADMARRDTVPLEPAVAPGGDTGPAPSAFSDPQQPQRQPR